MGNLKACTGECDADSQCAFGLKCFQRSKGEKIPGCTGKGGGKDWDYCYNPSLGGKTNNNGGSHDIVLSGGNNGKAKNLKACKGECDADSQCKGPQVLPALARREDSRLHWEGRGC